MCNSSRLLWTSGQKPVLHTILIQLLGDILTCSVIPYGPILPHACDHANLGSQGGSVQNDGRPHDTRRGTFQHCRGSEQHVQLSWHVCLGRPDDVITSSGTRRTAARCDTSLRSLRLSEPLFAGFADSDSPTTGLAPPPNQFSMTPMPPPPSTTPAPPTPPPQSAPSASPPSLDGRNSPVSIGLPTTGLVGTQQQRWYSNVFYLCDGQRLQLTVCTASFVGVQINIRTVRLLHP